MAQTWPASLQQLLNEVEFSNTEGETVIKSDMDVGPPKYRRRFTKGIDTYTGSITLTQTQYTTFKNFFRGTLNGGTLSFDFNNPFTGDPSEFRFDGVPSYRSLGGGIFQASFAWKEVP